jgi:hypothetical protein
MLITFSNDVKLVSITWSEELAYPTLDAVISISAESAFKK